MSVTSVANAPRSTAAGNLVYSSSMSTLSSTNVSQSVGSFGMVTWNVPLHVTPVPGVTFTDARSTGRAGDVNDGPTREWALLRQRRDLGRKVPMFEQ